MILRGPGRMTDRVDREYRGTGDSAEVSARMARAAQCFPMGRFPMGQGRMAGAGLSEAEEDPVDPHLAFSGASLRLVAVAPATLSSLKL